jgi:hypothetical protein
VSNLFLAIVTVLYAGIAADQIVKAEYAMALVWTGYALANIGFLLVVK